MKIAIITDTHHGVRNDNPVFQENIIRSLGWFFGEVKSRKIKTIFHLGDLYDRRRYINFKTASEARKYFLEPIEKNKIEAHIIAGNHDIYYKDTNEINALRELVGDRYSNIHVYDDPTVLNIGGTQIQFIPWSTERKRKQTIDVLQKTTADIVMGHLDIKGLRLNRREVSREGFEQSIFSRFDLVFSGHFHHKHSIGNIYYLGAFSEHDWNDHKDPRGFTIFDTETRKFEFIENPYSLHKAVYYDDADNKNILTEIQQTDFGDLEGKIVKVICRGRENLYAYELFMDAVHAANPVSVVVENDIKFLTEGLTTEDGIEEYNEECAQDTPTILDSYIKSLTLPMDNDKMSDYMKGLYRDAVSNTHIRN